MKKIKTVALQAFICNAFLFISMLMVGRGLKKIAKDIVNDAKFFVSYFTSSYDVLKVLAILGVVVLVAYLIYAIVMRVKKSKKMFGPLYIGIVIYFVALIFAHSEVIQMALEDNNICNITCGLFIITSAALSLFYLVAYGVIDTYQMVEALQDVKEEPKTESPCETAPAENKEENKDETSAQAIVTEEPVLQEEKKIEESTISSIAVVVPKSETSEEDEEEEEGEKGYSLTEEGYLPLDESPKSVAFIEDFIPLYKNRKKMYSDIKNAIMCYQKVKNVPIKAADQFKIGNTTILRITAYMDDLYVYLAIDPYSIDANTFYQYDADQKYEDTPCCIKVHSKTTAERVKQLIILMKQQFQLEENEDYKKQDYSLMDSSRKKEDSAEEKSDDSSLKEGTPSEK